MRRICLILMAIAIICFSIPDYVKAEAGNSSSSSQLVERLERIAASMQQVHFCFNENCFYRDIKTQIEPPSQPDGQYTATISAIVDRPGGNINTADYHFIFNSDRWQLVKGEEYTDMADYFFDGDRYEIYSSHTNRTVAGNVAQAKAQGSLKSGYLPLYFDILNRGLDRI
ncbi:hypothetical protein [Pseudanabaena sp. PCC 6802]|uniref:hypothetical protein n=1 Tax=Pseudanabaena sp. PCC 6802 TaxID=118173 RepID=UPI00037914BA|nr:hypothetical protein [Pseudanabaena sp. PCC 6802]